MPLVWPATSADDRAAARPTESTPGLAQLLIFLAATVAFVAIAVRTVLKLTASRRAKPERREPVRRGGADHSPARAGVRPGRAVDRSDERAGDRAPARGRQALGNAGARAAPPGLRGGAGLRGEDGAAAAATARGVAPEWRTIARRRVGLLSPLGGVG